MSELQFSRARSLSNDGEFDYNSFLIRLKNLTNKDRSLFDPILDENFNWNKWGINDYEYTIKSINAISTLIHEYTHFLDTTATTWGDQYTLRKLLLLEENNKGSDKLQNRIDVFHLNISEIKNLHTDLVKISKSNYNEMISINHAYDYSKNHGSIVYIILNYKDSSQDYIPVSMLAVNEGHAFCNEMIFKLKLCQKIYNNSLRNTLISIFEKDFQKFLNSAEQAEYNILLKLCHIHFKNYFNTEEILTLTSIILGFSLDCDDMLLASFSYFLEKTISRKNIFIAQALTQDMRRGHSRYFLAFKLILIIYEVYISQDREYKILIEKISKNNKGRDNLYILLEYILGEKISDFSFMKDSMLSNLTKITKKYKNNYILSKISKNRTTYLLNSYIINEINDYKTLNFLLCDDTIIKLQNSIDLDIESYFLEDLDESFSILNTAYDNVKKFHMNPYEVEAFLNDIKNQF
ncbi:hypothetical protein I5523_08690 [Acinetobacter oleivorans]|uniref:hypothetical protein n=1 Tax=Acinetobacter oleivorans TaxID=1148157 RepID=UPI0018FF856E|nr:hypothetical protein [Acinetobacter oleivorans]MBJ9739716.1 hypothetical protein [Acinetobacter oleivorans]MCU4409716.1 hypothetical protein [Acinetobacter oleivorans]